MRERIRRNVGLGMAVILLVSSLGVPPASAGTVREGKSLAEAEMAVLSGPVEYNGSEQKPKVSIHLDGVPLREGVDYRLSYADNLDAGTAVVMATGTGAYHGSREAKFTILPRTISAQALQIEAGCQKKYDETTEAFPTVSVQVLPGDQVEVRCTAVYDTCFVGRGKTVTVSGLHFGGPDGDNYRLEPSDLVLKTTGQITPQLPDFQKSAALAKGHSLDLRTLFSDAWKGEARFQLTGEALGCTRPQLQQAFRARLRRTAMEEFSAMRIEYAAQLLARGASPGEVAAQMGYCSGAYFSQKFRAATGHTPSAYRRIQQGLPAKRQNRQQKDKAESKTSIAESPQKK